MRWLCLVLVLLGLCAGCSSSPLAPADRLVASPDGTTVVSVTDRLVDSTLHVWTLGPQQAVLENGVQVLSPDFGGVVWQGYAIRLAYRDKTVYALGLDDGLWWRWDGTRFVVYKTPIALP